MPQLWMTAEPLALSSIGERTRDPMGHKRTNGERVGNIQFGYRLCSDGKHLEPDPGEQAVLDEIRRLRQAVRPGAGSPPT